MTMNLSSLGKINYFFKDFFSMELDMESYDNRIRLQKLIYILSFYGVKFDYNFTWWKHGPYSPKLTDDGYAIDKREKIIEPTDDELKIVEKIKKGKEILKNSKKAELVASYLYLQQHMRDSPSIDEIISELTTRKPYVSVHEVQQVVAEWNKAINKQLHHL
jgi:uncharacterized protein YwgA